MSVQWVAIESIAVLVESLAVIYFLNSRYKSKYETKTPQWFAWALLAGWGLFYVFVDMPINDSIATVITYGIAFAYLCTTKYGRLTHKVFGVVLALALSLGVSLAGASVVSLIVGESIEHTLIDQDTCRLLTIILIKAMQVILFYMLSKRQNLQRIIIRGKSVFLLSCAAILVFSCLLFMFFNLSSLDAQASSVMAWIAVVLLVTLVGIFYLYEVFSREEMRNIRLSENLQRLELEKLHFKELDAVYSGLRTWRHEHKNNLLALRAFIENETPSNALEYLDSIGIDSAGDSSMLQTGNLVLDAVVSAKLRLARSMGIDVDVQAVYPESNRIAENDLCAIIGNLLDNAIEACAQIDKPPRFISISLLVKGKNLAIAISNSFNGEVVRDGEHFLTSKDANVHGIGIPYVDSIVEKNQGHVLRKYNDEIFETYILLPLITNEGGSGNDAVSNKENREQVG